MDEISTATIADLTLEPNPHIWLTAAPAVLYKLEYSTNLLQNNWQSGQRQLHFPSDDN